MNHRRTTLTRARRPLLGAAALVCFAVAIVLTPSDVRSQLAVRSLEPAVEATLPLEPTLAPIAPDRDAFAPRASADEDPPPAAPRLPAVPLPTLPTTARALTSVVPPTRVTAIATGSRPTAIVESGGSTRVVTIGDTLDGSSIATIGDGMIALTSGRRLILEPAKSVP